MSHTGIIPFLNKGKRNHILHDTMGKELPKGWKEVESKSRPGEKYFLNTKTGEKTWKKSHVFSKEKESRNKTKDHQHSKKKRSSSSNDEQEVRVSYT
jgi:hypothetical protein